MQTLSKLTKIHKLTKIQLDNIQESASKISPVFDVKELLDKATTARLVLGDQVYVLRITRQNKLLLTK